MYKQYTFQYHSSRLAHCDLFHSHHERRMPTTPEEKCQPKKNVTRRSKTSKSPRLASCQLWHDSVLRIVHPISLIDTDDSSFLKSIWHGWDVLKHSKSSIFGFYFDLFWTLDETCFMTANSFKRESRQKDLIVCVCVCVCVCARARARKRKHGALRPQKPIRLIRDGPAGGSWILYLTPIRSTVITRMILH